MDGAIVADEGQQTYIFIVLFFRRRKVIELYEHLENCSPIASQFFGKRYYAVVGAAAAQSSGNTNNGIKIPSEKNYEGVVRISSMSFIFEKSTNAFYVVFV